MEPPPTSCSSGKRLEDSIALEILHFVQTEVAPVPKLREFGRATELLLGKSQKARELSLAADGPEEPFGTMEEDEE